MWLFYVSGWFDASVSLTEDMQNQLREASDKSTELETVQWCDISTPVPAADNISEYIASDEDSDADDKEVVDFYCLTPTQSDEESDSSSTSSEVDSDDLEGQFWFSSMAPQFMGEEEAQFPYSDTEVPDGQFSQGPNSFWQSLDVPIHHALSGQADVENQAGAWGICLTNGNCEDYLGTEAFDEVKVLGCHSSDSSKNNQLFSGHQSDSDGSDVLSSDSTPVSTLKQFKHDVTVLLNLLLDEKFAHPYGTIAGAVA